MDHWYLGTIGFSYKDWVGEFYPRGTSQREYLPYYCKVFNSVELNTTFHSIPQLSTVQSWVVNTPADFVFCLKTPRAITHELGLKRAQGMMDDFLEALKPLQKKAGPILVQLPPSYSQDYFLSLKDFIENLPPTHQYAIEFRHPSWYNDKTRQLLASHHIGWVSIDYPNLPTLVNDTAEFLYFRWIGVNGMYQRHTLERVDKTEPLRQWQQAINPYLSKVKAIYGFFNNDYAGFAAGTCKRFMQLVGLATNAPDVPHQAKLF
jgi:uncharacterized protein YecE (DUF72 family)